MNQRTNRFTEVLLESNGIDRNDFQCWIFASGMLFNSPDKWWGDLGRRDFPHEGIDFCFHRHCSGKIVHIGNNIRIPAMNDGVVRAIFSDYLGQAVIVEHQNMQENTGKLVSIYAHTTPLDHVQKGFPVKQGDIFAVIANTRRSKANILPHLHYTVGRTEQDLDWDQFVWNDMRAPHCFSLLDPLSAIDLDYEVVPYRELER